MLKDERSGAFAAQGSVNVDGRILLREFDRRLGRPEAWARPHFLYFNLQSAHFPYFNPGMDRVLTGEPIARGDISAANRDRVARTYWNAIAYNDRLIGALIERLRRLGVLDNSIIVVTADHGESLFDDGFLGHGHMLNDQQTRIPFILSAPNVAMPDVVGLDDMRAIILAAAGATVAAAGRPAGLPVPRQPRPARRDRHGRRQRPADRLRLLPGDGLGQRHGPAHALRRPRRRQRRRRRAADALIDEWARQRWLRHLDGGG